MNLTFAEQVKIILSRKGMTIKELAETIEEQTGKKMSRQNLTQRLGRDNFQEQDMRMIADILGCPFYLSILNDEKETEVSAETPRVEPVREKVSRTTPEKTKHKERDITIGELVDIHKELDKLMGEDSVPESVKLADEEPKKDETAFENEAFADAEAAVERMDAAGILAEEALAVQDKGGEVSADSQIAAEGNIAEGQEEVSVEELLAEVEEEKEEVRRNAEKQAKKSRGWRGFFTKRLRREEETVNTIYTNEEPAEEPEQAQTTILPEDYTEYEARETAEELEAPEESAAAVMAEDDEDLEHGDVNPATGHEYETNSVRTHPKRIGYVQVYDRGDHQWTDMTEWAFIGYQERKKALLGADYEPPIYLD